jgi:hypothetical protein
VVFLRWRRFRPEDPGIYLANLFKSDEIDFTRALTVIDEDTIRQRKYPPTKTP